MSKRHASICFAIPLVMMSSLLYGQSDSSSVYKNEIGICLGPAVLVLLGGQPQNQPLGLAYKVVKKKSAFRTSLLVKSYHKPLQYSGASLQFLSDSTYNRMNASGDFFEFTARLGMEKRHETKGGILLITGVDVQGRNITNFRNINQTRYSLKRIENENSAEPTYVGNVQSIDNLLKERAELNQLGLGFSLGANVPLGDRWWLSGQFRLDGYFGSSETVTHDKVLKSRMVNRGLVGGWNVAPPLSELVFYYRF